MTVGLKPYRGVEKPKPRPPDPAIGTPGIPGIPPAPASAAGMALVQLAAANCVPVGLIAGAAAAQA